MVRRALVYVAVALAGGGATAGTLYTGQRLGWFEEEKPTSTTTQPKLSPTIDPGRSVSPAPNPDANPVTNPVPSPGKTELDKGTLGELFAAVAAEPTFKNIFLGDPSLDPKGVRHVVAVVPSDDAGKQLDRFVREFLAKKAPTQGNPPACAVDLVVTDPATLPRTLQARCARSDLPVLRQTRLDAAKFQVNRDNRIVLEWKGVSLRHGKEEAARKELRAALARETEQVLKRPITTDSQAITFKADPAHELQNSLADDPDLEDVLFRDSRFDENGKLVIEYKAFTEEQKKKVEERKRNLPAVQELEGKTAALADTDRQEEEEVSALVQDDAKEKKVPARGRLGRVRQELSQALAASPTLRCVRVDKLRPLADREFGRVYTIGGVALLTRNRTQKQLRDELEKFLEKALPQLLEKQGYAQEDLRGLRFRVAGADNAAHKKAGFTFEYLPSPIPVLQAQAQAARDASLDGLLFLDAGYDDGALQIDGLLGRKEHLDRVRALVEALPAATDSPFKHLFRDGKGEKTARFALDRMKRVNWEGWQKSLAQTKEAADRPLRQVRLERLVWDHARDGTVRVLFHGVSIFPGEETVVRTGLNRWLQAELQKRLEAGGAWEELLKSTGQKQVATAPAGTGFRVVPGPLRDLRLKATTSAELAGLLLADAFLDKGSVRWVGLKPEDASTGAIDVSGFDEMGKLQLRGIVVSDEQRKLVGKLVDEELRKKRVLGDKESVGLAGLIVHGKSALAGQFQKLLAETKRAPFHRARIDGVAFRYHGGDDRQEPAIRLGFEGVCLADDKAKADLAKKFAGEADALLKVVVAEKSAVVPLSGEQNTIAIAVEPIKFFSNPLGTLQARIAATKQGDGVLVKDVSYTDKGVFRVSVLADDEKQYGQALATLLKDGVVEPAVLSPKEPVREPEVRVEAFAWGSETIKNWPALKKALQTALARLPVKSAEPGKDWALRQTGIKRMFFEYDDRAGKAYLAIEGLSLFDPNLEPRETLKLAEAYRQASDEQRRAMLEGKDDKANLRKPRLETIQQALQEELRKLLPQPEYGLRVERIRLVESPIADVNNTLPAKLAEDDGVVLLGLYYDPDGKVRASASRATPANRTQLDEHLGKSLKGHAIELRAIPKKIEKENKDTSAVRPAGLLDIRFVGVDEPEKKRSEIREWQEALSSSPLKILRETRLDRRRMIYNRDLRLVLVLHGVCIHDTINAVELAQQLATATRVTLHDLGRGYWVDVSKLPFKPNPVLALQQLANRKAGDRYPDGLLFHNARYDGNGTLLIDVLLGDDDQKAIADKLLEDRPIPEDVLVAKERGVPRSKVGPPAIFDWKRMLAEVRKKFAGTAEDRLARHTRLDRAYFAYAGGITTPELRWEGVCIEDRQSGTEAIRKALAGRLDACRCYPPGVKGVRNVTASIEMPGSPVRDLRQQIVNDSLDGVGIADAVFDAEGKLVLEGIWNGADQQAALHKTAVAFLTRIRLIASPDDVVEQFQVVRTRDVLTQLREWTAANLDEVWIERLYFDRDGVLTIRGIVPVISDRRLLRRQLIRLLDEHPRLKGRFGVGNIVGAVGKKGGSLQPIAFRPAPPPPPEDGPRLDLHVRKPITDLLRRQVQAPLKPRQLAPPRSWDGMVLRRGYYTPEGKFALEGLCDSDEQRNALGRLLRGLAPDAPYREALAQEFGLSAIREMPLEPMLRRLRILLPAYEVFDGLTLDSACHDVENRLVLRFFVVGEGPGRAAQQELRAQLAGDRRWRLRVDEQWLRVHELDQRPEAPGPLVLGVLKRQRRDEELAEKMVLESIATLRRGIGDLKVIYCRGMTVVQAREYRQQRVDRALRMLDLALLHDPRENTAWYLRATCYLERNDTLLVSRDLRQLVIEESAEGEGKNRKRERLIKCEHLQGDFRRRLDGMRKRIAEDIRTGLPPLKLSDIP